MTKTGQCLCGQVRYSFEGEPQMTAVCHCRNCQRQAGSAFSILISLPKNAVSAEGEVKTYRDKGESGGEVDRQFCPECGSPVFTLIPNLPEMIFIKAGTLDDVEHLKPGIEFWTKSAQPWVAPIEGAVRAEKNPS